MKELNEYEVQDVNGGIVGIALLGFFTGYCAVKLAMK